MKPDENGIYRWRHSVNLYRNPGILWLLCKVFSWIFVGTVKVDRRHNTVHIRNGLFHNQIFAGDEDFDFVVDFIVGHCPKARVRFKPPRDFTDDDFNNKPSSKAKKKRSTNHVF